MKQRLKQQFEPRVQAGACWELLERLPDVCQSDFIPETFPQPSVNQTPRSRRLSEQHDETKETNEMKLADAF